MSKTILIVLISAMAVFSLNADSYSTFQSIVDFRVSLKELAQDPSNIDPQKLYLVEGTIRDLYLDSENPDTFYAEAAFVHSEWQDLDDIITHKIGLLFTKPEFAPMIETRPSRNDGTRISVNTRGIALIEFVRLVPRPGQSPIPTFIVHEYRVVK